jgi:hypothetical protein
MKNGPPARERRAIFHAETQREGIKCEGLHSPLGIGYVS